MKIAIIGAGSVSFCPATVSDIFQNEALNSQELIIALMDIDKKALDVSGGFCSQAKELTGRSANILLTLDLEEALRGADFVVTAIEVDRYFYWSQDFHIPRKYGFRQIYGENGGPGGMFHTLRNLPPLLKIAKTMERLCPEAWLLNYTNPEAKLVEMIGRETSIKVVGLCHGDMIGTGQLSRLLEIPVEDLDTEVSGINHFGWFTKIAHKKTGEDLYPLLKKKEREIHWLAQWDEYALPRIMLRAYGLWVYPGTNHVGEYIAWSDEFLASAAIQYFYDPAAENPWEGGKVPDFVYSFGSNPTAGDLYKKEDDLSYQKSFEIDKGGLSESGEYGVPIMEAIAFDKPLKIGAVNMTNTGFAKGLPLGMAVEVPAIADGRGITPQETLPLPTAVNAMIAVQGAVHKLIYEAYKENSRNKLLQAALLDPTASTYNKSVGMINELCRLQKDILPELNWEQGV